MLGFSHIDFASWKSISTAQQGDFAGRLACGWQWWLAAGHNFMCFTDWWPTLAEFCQIILTGVVCHIHAFTPFYSFSVFRFSCCWDSSKLPVCGFVGGSHFASVTQLTFRWGGVGCMVHSLMQLCLRMWLLTNVNISWYNLFLSVLYMSWITVHLYTNHAAAL